MCITEHYSALKKNEILPFATICLDIMLKGIVLSEISQTENDKHDMMSYMWNLNNKTNEQTKQKQTHRYREQTGGCQKGRRYGGGVGNK